MRNSIRYRKSYILFKNFYYSIKNDCGPEGIFNVLGQAYDLLNNAYVFKSATNAGYARESSNQLIIDIKANDV